MWKPDSKDSYIDAAEIPAESQEELFLLTMGAAIQNMLLAATSLGLGSTWIARPARIPRVREILRVPKKLRIISFVALGFASQDIEFSGTLGIPIRRKTHHNRCRSR